MGSGSETELFDPAFLSRLRVLFFTLRKRRRLRKKGSQAMPAAGFTREFKDRRQYTAGDDFRTIDWRIFARLERIFIRIYEEVQEFHIHLIVDRSGSMAEPYGEKRIAALRIAVALAYLGLVNDHRVSIVSLAEDVRRELAPLKGQGHIHAILRHCARLPFGGVTDLAGGLKRFRPGRDRRGIVFLISDLFGEAPELSEAAIRQATAWPAETHIVHVLHPAEIRPELSGELKLREVETGEIRRMWITARECAQYAEAFDHWQEGLKAACMGRWIDYVPWVTELPFEETFVQLLSRGSQLAGES